MPGFMVGWSLGGKNFPGPETAPDLSHLDYNFWCSANAEVEAEPTDHRRPLSSKSLLLSVVNSFARWWKISKMGAMLPPLWGRTLGICLEVFIINLSCTKRQWICNMHVFVKMNCDNYNWSYKGSKSIIWEWWQGNMYFRGFIEKVPQILAN